MTDRTALDYTIIPITAIVQNCTIFWCPITREAAVIDPGGENERIEEALTERGLTLMKILITHGHIDHAGGAFDLAVKYGVPIEGPHKDDLFWIEGMPQQSRMFGYPAGKSFKPARWLQDGDKVTFGEIELDVIHCPGHTPGHVVFYHRPSKLVHVGDVLHQGSVGLADSPRSDYDTLVRAIREKLLPLGDDVEYIPGHGALSTLGDVRRDSPVLGAV